VAGRYFLDTHVLIELGSAEGLQAMPATVRRLLADPETERLISVASEIEIAIKNRIGKLHIARNELATICAKGLITSYPIRREHADRLFDLPLHHRDPFDRLIISTALTDNIPVITRDRQFRKYKGLQVVW